MRRRSTARTPTPWAGARCCRCCRSRSADGRHGTAVLEIADELLGALLGPAVDGHQVLGELADVVEGRPDLFGRRGEDQRVRGLADAVELSGLQLRGTEVVQRLDDPAVRMSAISVHGVASSRVIVSLRPELDKARSTRCATPHTADRPSPRNANT